LSLVVLHIFSTLNLHAEKGSWDTFFTAHKSTVKTEIILKEEHGYLFDVYAPTHPGTPKIQGKLGYFIGTPTHRHPWKGRHTPFNSPSKDLRVPPHPVVGDIPSRWWRAAFIRRPVHSCRHMGKGLRCADCGREFRGERRHRCSDRVLTVLQTQYPHRALDSASYIHHSCLTKIFRATSGTAQPFPEVRNSSFSHHIVPWAQAAISPNSVCSPLPADIFWVC